MSDEHKRDDETDAPSEASAKDELFEAIDHFKNAASILFGRAANDPAVKSATKEAGKVVKKIGDAAEPLAKQLTSELSRLTRDVMDVVDSGARKKSSRPPADKKARPADEEE